MYGIQSLAVSREIAALKIADEIAAARMRGLRREARAARRATRRQAVGPQVQVVQPRRYAGLAVFNTICIVVLVVFTFFWAWLN
jgi:hypothetical protein